MACMATALPDHMMRQALSIVAGAYNQNTDKHALGMSYGLGMRDYGYLVHKTNCC